MVYLVLWGLPGPGGLPGAGGGPAGGEGGTCQGGTWSWGVYLPGVVPGPGGCIPDTPTRHTPLLTESHRGVKT